MTDDERFRQVRRAVSIWKCALEQLQDIKTEHDNAIERLFSSLEDIEEHLKEKGIDIELCHLVNYTGFLDDKRMDFYRKKILDHGNNVKREIENDK